MATSSKKLRILSIDGGGIRGIIPGQILVTFESLLQSASGNPDARIADYFDLIAGTSTGGILTCLYLVPDTLEASRPARPRYSAQQAVDLYLERGDEIFDVSFWHKIKSGAGVTDEKYSADALEEASLDYFGHVLLSQLIKPCLVTAYDLRRRQAHFFNSADAKKNGPAWDFYVRDVARATSAAPTYFECARVKSMDNIVYPLIDGGLAANNPALCAYAEARGMPRPQVPTRKAVKRTAKKTKAAPTTWTAKDMCILSLGTGSVKTPYIYKEAKDWGMVEWVQPVIDILMSASAETIDYQLRKIYDAVGAPDQYLRIDCNLPSYVDPAMDCATLENMSMLRDLGSDLTQDHIDGLERFIAVAG